MSFGYNPILGMLDGITTNGEMLRAISERQRINANNVANAHTPGYTAKEASFSDLLANMGGPFETELSRKMGKSTAADPLSSTGKPVNLQHEFIEMQKNNLFYSMETRLISSTFSGLKSASQVGR